MTDISLVTGGAGFIGSNFVKHLVLKLKSRTCVIDKLTYAGHIENLEGVLKNPLFTFKEADILDRKEILKVLQTQKPNTVFHLAAESHVDKSIDNPGEFVSTNVLGTQSLLDACLTYWKTLDNAKRKNFKVIVVSTDEVFGSIEKPMLFNESSQINPSSPYSASKASADLLALSYYKTYELPVIITNSSNNYGPNQSPEKLIPLCILKAMNNETIPVYGNGSQIRDWIHVNDHVKALIQIALVGIPGERYCIGANTEKTNLEIVYKICSIIDEIKNKPKGISCKNNIDFTTDRPAHDQRYAIDNGKIRNLHWEPRINFNEGIHQTVLWYLQNKNWINVVTKKNIGILNRQGNISKS